MEFISCCPGSELEPAAQFKAFVGQEPIRDFNDSSDGFKIGTAPNGNKVAN
jgi:hypothetical protein